MAEAGFTVTYLLLRAVGHHASGQDSRTALAVVHDVVYVFFYVPIVRFLGQDHFHGTGKMHIKEGSDKILNREFYSIFVTDKMKLSQGTKQERRLQQTSWRFSSVESVRLKIGNTQVRILQSEKKTSWKRDAYSKLVRQGGVTHTSGCIS